MKKFNAALYIRHDVTGIEAESELDLIKKLRKYVSEDEDFLILDVQEQKEDPFKFLVSDELKPNFLNTIQSPHIAEKPEEEKEDEPDPVLSDDDMKNLLLFSIMFSSIMNNYKKNEENK